MTRLILAWAFSIAVFMSPAISAHHSGSRYDGESRERLEGTIVAVEWSFPHVYVLLEVENNEGSVDVWEIEGLTPVELTAQGWSSDSVVAGDRVTAVVSLNRNPDRHEVRGRRIIKNDGTQLSLYEGGPPQDQTEFPAARTSDLSGVWMVRESLGRHFAAGNIDYGPTSWGLTEAGKAALDSFIPTAKLGFECLSGGPPMNLVWSGIRIMLEIGEDSVSIHSSALGHEVRPVRMDRGTLEGLPYVSGGQSIGRWDGDVLVVETGRYLYHPSGNAEHLASSSHKRLTERFQLTHDGTSLTYSFVLEDPVYLAGPVELSMEWAHRPDLDFSEITACDNEVARRGFE